MLLLCGRSVDAIIFVPIDPVTGWRDLSPWEESDGCLASFPRAHGGVFQAAEEESGEGVRSERAGKNWREKDERERQKDIVFLCKPNQRSFLRG